LPAVPCVAGPSAAPAAAVTRSWHFEVSLDGRPIGWHDFTVRGTGQDGHVEDHARFKVTVLLIPLDSYEHWDRESWQGDCLSQIDARTRENGHEYLVRGQRAGDAFEVHGPRGSADLQGCIRSFAYWDPDMLTARYLLNAQTGEYEQVRMNPLGESTVRYRGREVQAQHYALEAGALRIELWYSTEGELIALRTRTAEGRTLNYEIPP
jgi:hypothetical protein